MILIRNLFFLFIFALAGFLLNDMERVLKNPVFPFQETEKRVSNASEALRVKESVQGISRKSPGPCNTLFYEHSSFHEILKKKLIKSGAPGRVFSFPESKSGDQKSSLETAPDIAITPYIAKAVETFDFFRKSKKLLKKSCLILFTNKIDPFISSKNKTFYDWASSIFLNNPEFTTMVLAGPKFGRDNLSRNFPGPLKSQALLNKIKIFPLVPTATYIPADSGVSGPFFKAVPDPLAPLFFLKKRGLNYRFFTLFESIAKSRREPLENIELLKSIKEKNIFIIFDTSILNAHQDISNVFTKNQYHKTITLVLKILGAFKNVSGAVITGCEPSTRGVDNFIKSHTDLSAVIDRKRNNK